MRTTLAWLAKLAVAVALLTWLFGSGRLDFAPLLAARSYGYLSLAGAALLVSMLGISWRWKLLMSVQGLTISAAMAVRLTWLSFFAALFLPGAAGGDLAKAYAACRRQPKGKTRAASAVLMDRVLGLHSLLFIGSIAGALVLLSGCGPVQAATAWMAISCLLVGTFGLVLLLWPRSSVAVIRVMPRRLRGVMKESLRLYQRGWRRLVAIWVFSHACSLCSVASYVLTAAAIGLAPAPAQVLAVPLVVIASSLPISPGGLGVGEAVGAGLFAEFGMSDGGLVVLTVRLGLVLLSAPGAIALLGRGRVDLGLPGREGGE